MVFTQVLSHPSVAARNGAGWHACLAELDRRLDAPDPDTGTRWEELYDDYLDRIGPPLGVADGVGAMTWERATHVDADRVRAATTDPGELEAWGAEEHGADPVRWSVQPTEHGTTYRLTLDGIGDDPRLAAEWHALLLQLDMYLAAGQLVPADPDPWVGRYREAMAGR
jgi:hypothetical protein